MDFAPANLSQVIAALQKAGKLPSGLSATQVGLLQRSLQKYSAEIGQRLLDKILADFKSKIETASSMTDPVQMRGVLADLQMYVGSEDVADAIKFSLQISQEVASGAGRYLNQNLSPKAVDEYPALEFKRAYDRTIPRGFKLGKKGALIAVPDDNWPTRWAAAGDAAGDDNWLDWEGDSQTGRGVALKVSGIWQALGDGAGGYTDTLGNAHDPIAFQTGFRQFDVSRNETVKLGLIGANEPAKPAAIDFSKLLSFAE